jgi:hypothetical protein
VLSVTPAGEKMPRLDDSEDSKPTTGLSHGWNDGEIITRKTSQKSSRTGLLEGGMADGKGTVNLKIAMCLSFIT